ncbi:MAG: triose-phosphate isomerase [Proteobacteria bacterium]|nr:triose-phosphate isomerase [Pseudomonadota bacterium]
MDRRPLVVGNWKMHGSIASARALARAVASRGAAYPNIDIAICPPFLHLGVVAHELRSSRVELGAQTLSEFEHGAYTGEIAAAMLSDIGCHWVIVGHSERRALFGDSIFAVAAKSEAAVAAGLTPIICVGETLVERKNGTTNELLLEQLRPFTENGCVRLHKAVIAYEPVWAIGTGETASPNEAQEVHEFIRATIAKHNAPLADSIRLLYGGSVKPDNAAELFAMSDVDGGLIGGASLKAEDFMQICGAAS